MKIVNLTGKDVCILSRDGEVIANYKAEKTVLTAGTEQFRIGVIGNVPINGITYGKIANLPNEEEGVFFIVDISVREALPTRKDLLYVGNRIESTNGDVGVDCLIFKASM